MRDPLFSTPPAGPDAASWMAAIIRALHPVRWGLGLTGVAATVAAVALSQPLFDAAAPRLADWFREPGPQAQAFGDQLAGRTTRTICLRLAPATVVVAAAWSLIGAWIARHELVARHRGRPYATVEPIEPGPTTLVLRRPKDLVLTAPMVLILCALLILPVALAGLLNQIGGVGAILVAVFLPVVLLANLILLLLAVGLLAWPLMPVAIAAETSDIFDGLSRAYNYTYMQPVRFALLLVVSLGLSALPLAGTLAALAGQVENWLSVGGHPAVWVAAGLSASVFWSLQTLVYLHLRTSVDAVDANEVAGDRIAEPAPPKGGRQRPAATPPTAVKTLLLNGAILILMVVTWVVTAKLFARFGGENAGWLAWGVGDEFRPPAEGLFSIASLLAAGWGFVWVAAPILVAGRRLIRPDDHSASPTTGEHQPNRS